MVDQVADRRSAGHGREGCLGERQGCRNGATQPNEGASHIGKLKSLTAHREAEGALEVVDRVEAMNGSVSVELDVGVAGY